MVTLQRTTGDQDPLEEMMRRLGRRGRSQVHGGRRYNGEWDMGVCTINPSLNGTSLPQMAGPLNSAVPEELPPNGSLSWDYRSQSSRHMCTSHWSCPESYWHIAQMNCHRKRVPSRRGRAVARNLASSLYKTGAAVDLGEPQLHGPVDAPVEDHAFEKVGGRRYANVIKRGIAAAAARKYPDAYCEGRSNGKQTAKQSGALAALAGF
mmetsp:Transcript_763/g.1218  ORF Transcript_763/g.1218 Transcript_763/m.1218 type:complete len:207 (-) Transcript_763:33-653(-)